MKQSIRNHALLLLLSCLLCAPLAADDKLEIGSDVPAIDIEYWISDNDGLFEHVKEFEKGKIYIIDFWATRSPANVAAMPFMANLQSKYPDDVQIISISDEDLDTVESFLERKIRGDKEKRTFGELTNGYCLTTDPDRSVLKAYFEASGKTATTFLVGKSGKLEWMGIPLAVEGPLKKVIEDDWDREEFKTAMEEDKKAANELLDMRRRLMGVMRKVGEKMQDGDEEGALETLDSETKKEESGAVKNELIKMRIQLVLRTQRDKLGESLQKFIDHFQAEAKSAENDDERRIAVMEVNNQIWALFERHEARGDLSKDELAICLKGSKWTIETEPESGAYLDTYAHLVYLVEEDLDKAIEYQKKAVEFAGPQVDDIRPFLDALLKEKETGKKPEKKKKKRVEESDF